MSQKWHGVTQMIALTLAIFAVIAATGWAFAGDFASRYAHGPADVEWIAPLFRQDVLDAALLGAGAFAAHWLVAGALGRGDVRWCLGANLLLAAAGLLTLLYFAELAFELIGPEPWSFLCPVDSPKFGFIHDPEPCWEGARARLFVYRETPAILLLLSTALRIFHSRRQTPFTGTAPSDEGVML